MATSQKVGLFGYSGGSIAGEWASELAPRYAPELNIVGTAIGGVPVHLAHNLSYVNGSDNWSGRHPGRARLASAARSTSRCSKYESAYGKKVVDEVEDECIGGFNGNYPGLRVQQLVKPKYKRFLKVPAFARVVNKLIMGSAKGHPRMPMYMGVGQHDGKGDDVMIAKDVEALAHQYCRQGVTVQFQVYDGADHTAGRAAVLPDRDGVPRRTASPGVPFAGNCADIGPGNSLAPLPVKKNPKG